MLGVFTYTVDAILPLLILAALGYILGRCSFAPVEFFKQCNTLVFRILLPVLIFINIYGIESLRDVNWSAAIYCVCATVAIILIGLIMLPLTKKRSQKGVMLQTTFRSNYAIIGIALAASLGGAPAAAFASVMSVVTIPIYNTLASIILPIYAQKERVSAGALIKSVAGNPLIRAVGLGFAVLVLRAIFPSTAFFLQNHLPFITTTMGQMQNVVTPLALIAMGAQFEFSAVKELLPQISLGVFMRLIFAPLVGLGGAILVTKLGWCNITAAEFPAMIAMYATPTAVSSAVMVGEIGGDEQLAGQIVIWTSVLSIFTLFFIIFVMRYAGFL